MIAKKGKDGSECHALVLRLFRPVVDVHNISPSIKSVSFFLICHCFKISLSVCHCSFSRLPLLLPCPMPLIILPHHHLNQPSYRPPLHQTSGNYGLPYPRFSFQIVSPRSLDHVFSTTSRRAAAFEQQIKAIEVCPVPSPSCHQHLPPD